MSNLIIQLLASEKFNGEGYSYWKSNINTILVVDDLRFVLMEECSPLPCSNTNPNVQEVYNRWANEKERAYILTCISDVLNKKHEAMPTARDIMTSLQEIPSSSIRHEAIKYVYNSYMKDETNVREHVLDMMLRFNIEKAHV
ncbi:uncharacterized protein LOC120081018 [Benincasa hispida]|uniref:uncharacterized protein LOC120081018 n=1 Tax=Benincasa hispida TaxID=102211 RepID=UPI0018FF6C14|nr:uncharacterized protein LOC120081018 [Benincasa hispida]